MGLVEQGTAEYKVRTFQDGDEVEILRIFEDCYYEYAGYVVRTPEYWRWCCLERPDVSRNSVFVVIDRLETPVGYAVVGKSGNVWELSVNKASNVEEIAKLLLKAAIDFTLKSGASSVSLHAPIEDEAIRAVCNKLGFDENKPPDVFVSVLDFKRLFLLLAKDQKEQLKQVNEDVEVRLRGAPTWMASRIGLKIRNGNVRILEEVQKPTVSIELDTITLSKLLLQQENSFFMWLRGRVSVKPFWKIRSVLKLFSLLNMKASWFTPLSDYG